MALYSQARAEILISRYSVNLGGVRIGDAVLHTTLDAKHYKIEVSADVGVLLNNTKVQGEATGSRTGEKLTPEHFRLVTSSGQESAIDFAAAKAKPNPNLRGILDPLSALLAASLRSSSAPDTSCGEMLQVLMSRNRFDVSIQPASDEQRDPRIVTCQVHFTQGANASGTPPKGLENIQWEVGFHKLSQPRFWLVEQLSLPTDMGTVTIERVETAVSGS